MKAQRIHQFFCEPDWCSFDPPRTEWRSTCAVDLAWVAGMRAWRPPGLVGGPAFGVEISLMGGMVYIVQGDFQSLVLEWMAVRGEPGP
jgi:hypothetical protein